MKSIYIMRGLPGGGKSRYCKAHFANAHVCSADFYHYKHGGGKYDWRKENHEKAHTECLLSFVKALDDPNHAVIVVDNTNLAAWEISPYYRLAQAKGYDVMIVRVECDPAVAWRRNVHKVPAETIYRMYRTLITEILPSHWKEMIIVD